MHSSNNEINIDAELCCMKSVLINKIFTSKLHSIMPCLGKQMNKYLKLKLKKLPAGRTPAKKDDKINMANKDWLT